MPTRRPRYLTRIIAAVGALAPALPSAASAAKPASPGKPNGPTTTCEFPAVSQVFAPWGDASSYYLAEGGDMESLEKWSASGPVALVPGNEPWYVAGAGDDTSLRLEQGASVKSPRLCVSAAVPHLRFFAKGTSGKLHVRIDVSAAEHRPGVSRFETLRLADHVAWAPSRTISLGTSGIDPGRSATAAVTFTSTGDWQVDDVFIDPRTLIAGTTRPAPRHRASAPSRAGARVLPAWPITDST